MDEALLPDRACYPAHVDVQRILRETFVARAESHRTVASTNDLAAGYADAASEELPWLVIAESQTAGRGRGGNRWWTGPGSLAFSLLLEAATPGGGPSGGSPLVALAAAVAVAETVAPLVPSQPVGIHWPNDVLAAGRKLAGVLVDVLPNRRQVVGIGVNTNCSLRQAPAELRHTATTLLELTGREHDHTGFLATLLGELHTGLDWLAREPQRIGVRADQLCVQHGRTLTVRQGTQSIRGQCAGIAPDGALLLETPSGPRAVYSGVLE